MYSFLLRFVPIGSYSFFRQKNFRVSNITFFPTTLSHDFITRFSLNAFFFYRVLNTTQTGLSVSTITGFSCKLPSLIALEACNRVCHLIGCNNPRTIRADGQESRLLAAGLYVLHPTHPSNASGLFQHPDGKHSRYHACGSIHTGSFPPHPCRSRSPSRLQHSPPADSLKSASAPAFPHSHQTGTPLPCCLSHSRNSRNGCSVQIRSVSALPPCVP